MENELAIIAKKRRAQKYRAKQQREFRGIVINGENNCVDEILQLYGKRAANDLRKWFDKCRWKHYLYDPNHLPKATVTKTLSRISRTSGGLLKALHGPGLDVIQTLLDSDAAAENFLKTLRLISERSKAPRNRGPQRDDFPDIFGRELRNIFLKHKIPFTASASEAYGSTSLAVEFYRVGLRARSAGSARKVIQRLVREMRKR